MDASLPNPEDLLREAGWIRSLAGRLVDDPALADDLAQETLLRALERPSRLPLAPRAWLAGVLRNVARQGRRDAGRRQARERLTSRDERVPPASDAVARLELQREVVEAVLALPEPGRSVVIERYFEDRPPRAIAERRGVPLATVKSQLARGVAELRRRLDRCYGDRRTWGLALLPLLPLPRWRFGWVLTTTRAILMGTTPKLLIGTLSAAGLALAFYATRPAPTDLRPEVRARDEARAPAELLAPSQVDVLSSVASPEAARVGVPVAAQPPALAVESEPAADEIAGTVLDLEGRGLAGIDLVFLPNDGTEPRTFGTSGPGGAFAGPVPAQSGTLGVERAGFATLLAARFDPTHPRADLVVVAARAETYAGRVFEYGGATLAGARLTIDQPQAYREPLEPRLHRTTALARVAESDAEGRFLFEDVPYQEGLVLRVQREGFGEQVLTLPAHTDRGLEVVLARVTPGRAGFVVGIVVASDGAPVPGAVLSGGGELVRTDATGSFELERAHLGDELRAAAAGYVAITRRLMEGEEWPDFLELSLVDVPLEIAGRVVDGEGRPLPGYLAWIDDATYFGESEDDIVIAESIACGESGSRLSAVSDAEGRFLLRGLAPRSYRVRVMERETALIVDTGPVAAGSDDVEVVFTEDLYRPRIFGRVVGASGEPVEGVGVRVETAAYTIPGTEMGMMAVGEATTTGANGRFSLARVPRSVDSLYVTSDQVMRTHCDLAPEQEDELEIRVELRVFIHVVASPDLPEDTRMSILDESGQALGLTRRVGTAYTQSAAHALTEGAFDIVSCAATARTLVLFTEGEELVRMPITLVPGETTRIEL